MRQPIETAPKDGRDIWVEDDRAAYDVAHWSSETKQWVWKNGGAIRITPTHWSPIPEPQYQEGEQLSSPLQVVRVRRWSTAYLIAAALVVAALIGVYFRTEMVAFATRYADLLDVVDTGTVGGRESLGTPRAPDADLREAASASQSFGPRETTAALVQDAGAARHAIPASTAQFRQALEQETLLSDALAGELAATRSELDTKVALADKAVDEAAQLKRAAEITAAELQKSLQQEHERSATLASELAKVRIDLEATVALPSKSYDEALQGSLAAEDPDELRKSLQQERARAAALVSELSGNRRDMETQAEQSQKALAAAVKQQQAAETAIAELQRSLQQEQKKTATLTQEAKAAQAEMRREIESKTAQSQKAIDAVTKQKQAAETAAAELRRSLQQEQKKTATLTQEAKAAETEMRREIETQAAQSQKAVDEAVQQKQMAEAATAQLREALQQEQQKTAALTQEAKAGQAMTTAADPERRAIEDAQAHAAALASELAGMRREIKTQAAQSQKAVDEAVRQKQTADAASTQLREALQQEQQKTAALTQEAKTAQADPERRALEDAQAHAAALASELAGMRREIETQAAQSQKAVDEAVQAATAQLRETLQQEQQKTAALTQEASAAHKATTAAEQERRSAESTIADLPSPPQEHQRAEMLSSEVRRKLKALATLSRQGSGKTASNRAAEDAKSELKPSLRQKRGQPKEITPSAESTRQSAGTAATEQRPVSIDANASEANGLLARAKALVVQGNILAARTVLERAAETGSAQATFALAETYDPNVLATWKTRGTRGDATRARDLYARAYEGGIKTAKDRSDSLVIGNGERPASWFGREEADH